MSRDRLLLFLATVALFTGALSQIGFGASGPEASSEHVLGLDDSYISFRYARNLADGHGLVFNPGERVEGYSNLLFVLVMAAGLRVVPPEQIYLVAVLFSLVMLAVAHRLFLAQARRHLPSEHVPAAAWLWALCPVLWVWTASGLETIAVLALQLALWRTVEDFETSEGSGGQRALGKLVALSALTVFLRADGFVLVVLIGVYLILRRRAREAMVFGLLNLPALLLLFGWRLVYYGELLPNTYYAKVSEPLVQRLSHSLGQLYDLSLTVGLGPYLIVLVLTFLRPDSEASPGSPRRPSFQAFFPLAFLAYWLYVGGDHFGERFLLLVFPFGIITLLQQRIELRWLLPVLLLLQSAPIAQSAKFDYRNDRYDGWIEIGRFLGERYPGHTLAVEAAGKIPYFSGLPAIDMRGLTDHHIARTPPTDYDRPGHNKRDTAYVLAREPDLITSWISPRLHLELGLDRQTYLAAGYRLAWLVNMTREDLGENVVDVSNLGPREIQDLLRRGYIYAVLEKAPGPSSVHP